MSRVAETAHRRAPATIDDLAGNYVPGHKVDVLLNGREAFPAMLRAIDSAERSCYLETYILRDDRTGRAFARALAARARAGVDTALVYDAVGSLGTLSPTYLGYLEDAGVRVAAYHSKPWRFWEWNKRNHRKILVVDGLVGFLGGLNIGDEYNSIEDGGGGWRDTHCRIQGPALGTLVDIFARDLHYLTGHSLARPEYIDRPRRGNARVEAIGNLRHGGRSKLKRAYIQAIGAARRHVLLTNAYFLPDRAIRRALAGAVARGVDVRVITAGISDVPLIQLASRSLYPGLIRSGVRLYERLERVLHAKTAVIDGRWCAIGSYNLNRRSMFHDLEVLAVMLDEVAGERLERAFQADLDESVEVDLKACRARPFAERFMGKVALRFGSFL